MIVGVLDDEDLALGFIKGVLELQGHLVLPFRSTKEFRAFMDGEQAGEPHLFVLDCFQNDKFTLGVHVDLIRRINPNARIIAISGAPSDERIVKVANEHGFPVLGKPFRPHELLDLVST